MVDLAWTVDYSWVIIVAPLVAFVLSFLVGRFVWEGGAPFTIGGIGISFVLSLLLLAHVLLNGGLGGGFPAQERIWFDWLGTGGSGFAIQFGVLVDNLSVLMLALVSFLSLLIAIYSVGYMHLEPFGKPRYYGEIALFVTGMLGTVATNNYLQLLVFWEIMGLCSYLLIGFWYYRPSAANAAKKAFLVTRVGDVLFLVGVIAVFLIFGTFNLMKIEQTTAAQAFPVLLAAKGLPTTLGFVVPLLIFGGAVGKSAQFPLHAWLPDAMEGPTTVSALIHAATMVKAGVFLTARTIPLLAGSPNASLVVAGTGAFTALFAATMALAWYDIKKVLAYSTISQLGYMFLGLGTAGYALATHLPGAQEGYTASLFHLMNHAFFKALLFLGAGSVLHAMFTNDMRNMGGLRKIMPITSITMLVGSLSIAGIPPLSGFWSKDGILEAAYANTSQNPIFLVLWGLGIITAFLTAFYMFRLWFMTFWGNPRWTKESVQAQALEEDREKRLLPAEPAPTKGAAHEEIPPPGVAAGPGEGPHESPWVMTGVLAILSVLAAVSGLLIFPMSGFGNFIFINSAEATSPVGLLAHFFISPSSYLTYLSALVGVLGVLLAAAVYMRGTISAATFTATSSRRFLQQLLLNRYYIDNAYNAFGAVAVYGFAKLTDLFDRYVIDGFVNGVARATLALARGTDVFDRRAVDGAVNSVTSGTARVGWRFRRGETGVVQNYVAVILLGIAIVGFFMIVILPRLGVR